MKKINLYYINDGMSGVVAAKSLKHCIKILLKNGYGDVKEELLSMKNGDNLMTMKEWENNNSWIYEVEKVPKSNQYHGKKSMLVGFME